MRKARSGAISGVAQSLAALALLLQSSPALGQTTPEQTPQSPAEDPEGSAPAGSDDAGSSLESAQGEPESRALPEEEPALPAPKQRATGGISGEGSYGDSQLGFGAYPNPAEPSAPAAPKSTTEEAADPSRIFAEDWWTHTRPTVEFHGNFRVRAQLFHHFALGRIDTPGTAMWPRPADDYYVDVTGSPQGAQVCTPSEAGTVGGSSSPSSANQGCSNAMQAGANMRFRLEPTIVISDNLRIRSQIDMLDNLVLGSTAQGYSNFPAATGYAVASRDGYTAVSGATVTQGAPVAGINSLSDSIVVKRAWGEYETPFGQARFGRMPDHWGLGLYHNAGDDIDGDFQSTVDRLSFTTGIPSLSLFASLAWDFPYEGATSQRFVQPGQPAYDLAQFDDVTAMNLQLFRRIDPQLEKLMLARGDVVINGGLYLTYSFQRIANDYSTGSPTCSSGANAIDCLPGQQASGYTRRGMEMWTPDLYAEVKYKKFRFAVEAVSHLGSYQSLSVLPGDNDYDNPSPSGEDGWKVNQWGLATEITQYLVEDRLKLGLYFGWGSGDGDVDGLVPGSNGMQSQNGDRTLSTFRFHPGYRVDLILNRHILGRVQGSYYLKPMAQYDFIRDANGMKLGGRAEAIWTRASHFMQAPGHQSDLGIELNGSIYFQSKDGSLNDDPNLVGGFYAMLQYGVLFPMGGLGYLAQQRQANGDAMPGLETAQTARLFLGIAY